MGRRQLTAVGLLSGTVYFAAVMIATPFAVPLAARAGIVRATAVAAITMAAGHLLFAVSPAFAGLLVARVVVGVGCAFALIAGPVLARQLGGVRLLGLFGGAVTLGIAGALGVGSLLQDAGVSWRVGFLISTAVCLLPLVVLPKGVTGAPAARPDREFIATALRTGATWRLLALFVAANGIPLVVGAWLVAYLTRDVGVSTAAAGGLGFLAFGLTTVVRPLGARLAAARRGFGLLAGGGSLIAALGLVVLAATDSVALALIAVLLMGIGFALPYAVMVDAAQRLFPDRATATMAIVQTGPNVVPMFVIPLVGTALDHRHAPFAFVLLAVFVAATALLNLTRPGRRRRRRDVIEQAAVLIVADHHDRLAPDVGPSPDRAEHLIDCVLAGGGRKGRMLGLGERRLHPRHGGKLVVIEVRHEIVRIGGV
jgi:predicted MFS family arabinose efflux permease